MSIASVSNRWLNRLYKVLAIMLVLLAVLISAFRLFLPYVENYRQDFQNYLNKTNQTHIVIGSLGMSWQRSGPTLIANRVTLIDSNNAHVYVEHLEVEIDFWATLTKQRLISSNLILDGAIVNLAEGVWEAKTKQDNVPPNSSESLDGFRRISDIFLNRINRFSLVNSNVSIKNHELKRDFRINHLNWLNSGKRHQAQGNVIVDELSSNNLNLKMDIDGQSIETLNGTVYLEANHLDITPWLDNFLAIENEQIKVDLSFAAWLKVNNGNIDRLQLSLHDNLMSWQESFSDNANQKDHHLRLSEGQLLLVKNKQADSLQLYSTPMLLQFDEEVAEEYILQMDKTAQDYTIYLSSFDLSLISHVSNLFITSPNTQKLLSELNINGQAHDLFFKKTTEDIKSLMNFVDVSTHYSQGIPGIDNLSGTMSLSEQYLHVDFTAEHGNLDFNQHFTAPIPYEDLKGNIDLFIADSGWKLNVNDIYLNSDELVLNADLTIDALIEDAASLSLLANVIDGDISKAGHYYPLTIMSDNLVEYLNGALIDGKLTQAQVLIHGELAKFPFADNSGTFIVDAEIEQSQFRFSKDWAPIKDFNANVNFTNNSMLITGRSGNLTGLDASGMQAAIDNLMHEQTLTVDALITPSSPKNIANLMNQSPLKGSVGSVLKQLNVKGDVNGEFHLSVPFDENESVLASGLINFVNNKVGLQTPQMNFEQVNGQLRFENSRISTQGLSLNWRGLPVTLSVNGSDKTDYYDTNITLNGDWQQNAWLQHLSPSLKKYFAGKLEFKGDLSLYQHHAGGFSYDFNIDSNLESLHVKLPEPYNKLAQVKTPLKISASGQLEQSTFNATYGEQLSFFGVLDHDTNHFSRAHIVLGNEKMLLPMDGFHITSNLAQADTSEWQPLIADIIAATSKTEKSQSIGNAIEQKSPLFSTPERIRGTIGKLSLLGQNLHNVSFNLLDKKDWWLLELNAKETRSQIKLYPDWLVQGIDVNADFLHLTSKNLLPSNNASQDMNRETALNSESVFANIPTMKFSCERCQIDDINFGNVNFVLSRTNENVITIENFKAKREQAEFNFSGEWQKLGDKSTTTIAGTLLLKNIEYELEQLGYGSIIRDSGGKLNFNVNWLGGPQDFSFNNLNGELKAKIDDGYLAEVSDKARIFSVLSLQSIVRKLTLDFRDIFSDGMFYKDIEGDYHIKEGVLYTDNTRMNGSAGNLYIKGNTSFVDNTLDYRMSYKPNLTSSLPVLAWIATLNPVVFLAGVAIDQVITSQVVSEFNFELTGDVSAPNFKEVNRKSRDITVGRSKPPEFVDGSDKTKSIPENKSFKEFNSPALLEHEYKEDPFKENEGLNND
jgi:uncharacterized protein (TIGR02099 family)